LRPGETPCRLRHSALVDTRIDMVIRDHFRCVSPRLGGGASGGGASGELSPPVRSHPGGVVVTYLAPDGAAGPCETICSVDYSLGRQGDCLFLTDGWMIEFLGWRRTVHNATSRPARVSPPRSSRSRWTLMEPRWWSKGLRVVSRSGYRNPSAGRSTSATRAILNEPPRMSLRASRTAEGTRRTTH
jgi:hypothetical protein